MPRKESVKSLGIAEVLKDFLQVRPASNAFNHGLKRDLRTSPLMNCSGTEGLVRLRSPAIPWMPGGKSSANDDRNRRRHFKDHAAPGFGANARGPQDGVEVPRHGDHLRVEQSHIIAQSELLAVGLSYVANMFRHLLIELDLVL